MANPLRNPNTAINWYPYYSATESAIIDMANSRQIALRTRLRDFYWLTECKPISAITVNLTRKKMMMIDPKDKMSDADANEVISVHYGFHQTPEGLVIPDLAEARGIVIKTSEVNRVNGAKGGLRKAALAANGVTPEAVPVAVSAGDSSDF